MGDAREMLRELCMAMPGAVEKLSHGEPTWFAGGKKVFVMFADHHHDERVGFWCAAPAGVQEELVGAEPERFYRPPYVGHRGWLGVYLDVEVDWAEVGEIVEEAYRMVATARLVAELDALRTDTGER
ncbi:MmcQ/YjbR family DNA-binding protein [Nocardia jejuensis]|uniref:MmcQ/YjbR family DNA-binding protein n=1 Tax=Nocardia jejuensis TaxID=328049 RepID=UPI000837796B|nr:MmcQ/YjbR family DNA-binding protein [Nocardia jejuensis]